MILGYESICWCFIDYLTAVKDTRLKRQGLKEIYNFVIFHKKENISKNEGPVSDLFMKIDNNSFSIALYDTTHELLFSLVQKTYLMSNTISKIFYSKNKTEILKKTSTVIVSRLFYKTRPKSYINYFTYCKLDGTITILYSHTLS